MPPPHCKLLFKMLFFFLPLLLRLLHLPPFRPTEELRQGGRLQSGRGVGGWGHSSPSFSAAHLNELVLPHPRHPPHPHPNLAAPPLSLGGGGLRLQLQRLLQPLMRGSLLPSHGWFTVSMCFFFFSLPPQVVTLGKNSRGYHYILANLVSNNGSCSPERQRDRFYPACWKRGVGGT